MACKFLITGARAPAALQLARILGRSGHEVFLADSMKRAVAYRSRWVRGHMLLPPPALRFAEFASAARQAVDEFQPEAVICTCEEIFYWAKAAELSPAGFASYYRANPSFQTLRLLHHKGLFARFARSIASTAGVVVPETRTRRVDACETERWVGKPAYSRFAVMTKLGLMPAQAQELLRQRKWIVQKQILGREICTWAFFVNGVEVCSTAYEPIYRAGRGSGIGLRGVEPGPAAQFARILAARLQYTGQLAFDWIQNEAGCHLLECNPRSTSGLHFLDGKSGETGAAIANAIRGLPYQTVLGEREDVAIKWAMLMFGALRMLRPRTGAEHRAFFRNARDADFCLDDPEPTSAVAIAAALSEIFGRAIRARSGLIRASTSDIEWNGDRFWKTK